VPLATVRRGGLRDFGLPSTAVDGGGTVYVAWEDCRYESGCSQRHGLQLVYRWDPLERGFAYTSGRDRRNVDHFIAGLGADAHTSAVAHILGLTYYYYPVSNCGSNCQLFVGFSLSRDGGQTWTLAANSIHGS